MGPTLAIIGALAGLASAGAAVKGAFSGGGGGSKAPAPVAPTPQATEESTPAQNAKKLGSLALISTSPQGLSSLPNYGRSKLLGG